MTMDLKDVLSYDPNSTNLSDFIINSSLDGIRAVDLKFNYILFNPAFEKITGLKKEEVLGRNAFDVFPFLRESGEQALFERTMKGETIYAGERPFNIPQTGRQGFFESIYAPLRDNHGKMMGSFAIVRDVSERKKTIHALSVTEAKLRNLNRLVTDGLVTCNKRGDVLSWSSGAEKIFGFSEEEALKLNLSEILPDYPWQVELRHLRSLEAFDRSTRCLGVRKNGSSVPLEISKSRWSLGLELFLSLGIKDLSDFNHLENQALELRELGEAMLAVHNDLKQGVIAMDIYTNRVVYANSSFASMLGYTVEELSKIPDAEFHPLRRELGSRIYQGEISNFARIALNHKDGSKVNVDAAARQVETSYGMIALFIIRNNFRESSPTQLVALE